MTRPLREFTRFIRWMQCERQSAANPQTKPPDLGCESTCRLPSSTPTVAIYYYYSARRLILIVCPTEGRRLSQPRWLATYRDGLSVCRWSVVAHSSSNWCRRRTAALIETFCATPAPVLLVVIPLILIMLLRSYSIHSHQLFFASVSLATPPYSKINIQQLNVKWKTAVYFGIWLNDFRYRLKEMLAGVQISFMGNFPRGRPFLARSNFYENCWTY